MHGKIYPKLGFYRLKNLVDDSGCKSQYFGESFFKIYCVVGSNFKVWNYFLAKELKVSIVYVSTILLLPKESSTTTVAIAV